MQQLSAVPVKASYYDGLEKQIQQFYWETIFRPLAAALKTENLALTNDAGQEALVKAVIDGKLHYDNGAFRGAFNSRTTIALRKLGAKWDKKTSTFKIPKSKLPASVISGIAVGAQRLQGLQTRIAKLLDAINLDDSIKQYEFDFGSVAKQVQADIDKTLKGIAVPAELSVEQQKNITAKWGENLKLYIKGWAEENILKLRTEVSANTMAGGRASAIEKAITKKYGASRNKARFLARQETALLVGKVREERYKSAGIDKYVWRTNMDGRERHIHADLNGQVFSWDSPPIIDEKGNRGHPSEAFGCRCRAVPVIE